MKSIIVGFIDSPEGHAAITKAIEEAKLRGMRLIVVHSMFGGSKEGPQEYIASAEAMEALEEELAKAGIAYEMKEYVRGNTPPEDLLAAVDEHDGEMIVIGIRKRTAAGKAILGSNALDILHDTKVPVLCVKANPS